ARIAGRLVLDCTVLPLAVPLAPETITAYRGLPAVLAVASVRCQGRRSGEVVMKPMPEDWQRAVAVVAHPDDLEYGAASAVARWTRQGKQVCYLLVTRGEAGIDGMAPADVAPLRQPEERRSPPLLAVTHLEFLDHP